MERNVLPRRTGILIVTYDRMPDLDDRRRLAAFDLTPQLDECSQYTGWARRILPRIWGVWRAAERWPRARKILRAIIRSLEPTAVREFHRVVPLDFDRTSETAHVHTGVQKFAKFPFLFYIGDLDLTYDVAHLVKERAIVAVKQHQVLQLPHVRKTTVELIGDSQRPAELPYVNLLYALEFCILKRVQIVSISLDPGPKGRLTQEDLEFEPFIVASRICHENGLTIVIAAGNRGAIGDNSINRWACSPWVISVGAARPDGKAVQPYTSRGDPIDRAFRPTVVGPDESRLVAPVQTGSSFATPIVAQVAADVAAFLHSLKQYIEELQADRLPMSVLSPVFVKRVVQEMARPIEGSPQQKGSGFVSPHIAHHYFKSFNYTNWTKLFPTDGRAVSEETFCRAKKKLNEQIASRSKEPYPWRHSYLEISIRRYGKYHEMPPDFKLPSPLNLAQIDVDFGWAHPVQVWSKATVRDMISYRGLDITVRQDGRTPKREV